MQTYNYKESRIFAISFLLLFILFVVVLVRTAWLTDDAFITFRSVLNLTHGYGPNFNPTERVQSYTHPLWFLLLSAAYLITGEIFITTIIVSIVITLIAIWLLDFRLAITWEWAIIATIALLLSKAFTDYATSGLENPLSYLLVAIFVLLVYRRADRVSRKDLILIVFTYSLIGLNRQDLILLVTPLLLWVFIKSGKPRDIIVSLLVGGLPLMLWLLFSLIYYGFPLPNTAYAKLGTGIERSALIRQGANFYWESLARDPITLTVIAFAVFMSLIYRSAIKLALITGILLYLVYVLMIGGDFMSGRFFAVPLFVAAILLVRLPRMKPLITVLIAATVIIVGFLPATPTVLSDITYYDREHFKGIADERGHHYRKRGLLTGDSWRELDLDWPSAADKAPVVESVQVRCGGLGLASLLNGPAVHLIDECGLADPLLARLPTMKNPLWRVGHYYRVIPYGYIDSIETSQNTLKDNELREFYEKIRMITRSELWSLERFLTIARINLGDFDELIDRDFYRIIHSNRLRAVPSDPDTTLIDSETVSQRKPNGYFWNAEGNVEIITKNLVIQFEDIIQDKQWLSISFDRNDVYKVTFVRENKILDATEFGPIESEEGGLYTYRYEIPLAVRELGFDSIGIKLLAGDGRYSVGHVLFD